MKIFFRNILILAIASMAAECTTGRKTEQSTMKVYPLGDSTRVEDGSLIYTLPMTLFKITFELEREISIPGPYSRYASDMLGLKDAITAQTENWSVRAVTMNSTEEIDPSEYYVIKSNSLC